MIRLLAKGGDHLGSLFQQIALLLNSLLPAILSPSQLCGLVKTHYEVSYAQATGRFTSEVFEWSLESWEQEVLDRYRITSGRILVLGSGVGREAIPLSQRGLQVVGLDISLDALQAARQRARSFDITPQSLQADFLNLPFKSGAFTYAMMSGIMYSSIPGRDIRQAWLQKLGGYLCVEGLAILNFLIDQRPMSRTQRLAESLNRRLSRMSGANLAYQSGDTCAQGHFLHAFQNEQEIREELEQAGVFLRELNWRKSYAVIGFPSQPGRTP